MKVLHLNAKEIFAHNLKRIRKEQKMTQVELYERSGVSQSAQSQLESGSNWPDFNTIEALAKALKRKQAEFFQLP